MYFIVHDLKFIRKKSPKAIKAEKEKDSEKDHKSKQHMR